MTVRVVLYAEGVGETGGQHSLLPPPGSILTEEMLGPAHILVGRAIEREWKVPVAAVRFESPLRTARGTVAHGSDLHDRASLRKLLQWTRPKQRPDLAIVLVDEDDDRGRKGRLLAATEDLPGDRVIAVAVREFESWLIADEQSLRVTLDVEVTATAAPEELNPGEAKQRFNELCDGADGDDHRKPRRRRLRHDVCRVADLDELRRRCRSFATFLDDLRSLRTGA